MLFYRIYQILVMVPVMLVVTTLAAIVTIIGSALGGARWWGYYPQIIWARLFCWLNFVTVSVTGHENIRKNTSYVFVANHQGAFDIFSIYGWLGHNFRWMMKKSRENPPCRLLMPHIRPSLRRQLLPLRHTRHHGRRRAAARQRHVRRRLPRRVSNLHRRRRRFKRGAYTLAVEFGLPVVPVTIDGAFRVMPRTAFAPRPGHIRLTIHRPIEAPADGHDLSTLIDASRAAILSSLEK